MNKFLSLFVIGAMLLCGSPSYAVVMEYMGPDGVTPVKVSEANPLPGSGGGGGMSGLATDTSNRLVTNIGAIGSSAVIVASISVGIVLQDTRTIASNSNTILADITSGTAAPFWMMIRNTGTQKIHVDSIAPGDTTDYIGPGEQYGPIYCGSNVLNEKFRANSAGASTWALTIRK